MSVFNKKTTTQQQTRDTEGERRKDREKESRELYTIYVNGWQQWQCQVWREYWKHNTSWVVAFFLFVLSCLAYSMALTTAPRLSASINYSEWHLIEHFCCCFVYILAPILYIFIFVYQLHFYLATLRLIFYVFTFGFNYLLRTRIDFEKSNKEISYFYLFDLCANELKTLGQTRFINKFPPHKHPQISSIFETRKQYTQVDKLFNKCNLYDIMRFLSSFYHKTCM